MNSLDIRKYQTDYTKDEQEQLIFKKEQLTISGLLNNTQKIELPIEDNLENNLTAENNSVNGLKLYLNDNARMQNEEDDEENSGNSSDSSEDKSRTNIYRTKRRASIAPLPALRLNDKEMFSNDFDLYNVPSNQASITSINSVASLLRERMQAFPQIMRKKTRETKDYKIKIFVILMFFIITFLIGYAYVGYHRHVLTQSYFDKINFNTKDRFIEILNHKNDIAMTGQLGIPISLDSKPFHCLEDSRKTDGSICIEWNGITRLYLNFQDMNVFRCYTIRWQSLHAEFHPTDCYALKRNNGLWFGGGITREMQWSLSATNFSFAPFTTGEAKVQQFGNAIKRYFINSSGVALHVDVKNPLHIKTNQTSNRFCLKSQNNDFTYVNYLTQMPELNYKICITEDMRSLHMLMTQKSLWDGLTETDLNILHALIEEPIWQIPYRDTVHAINETTIYNYSEEIIAMGYMNLGHILVNEFWQENIGDFTIDETRFPTFKDTIDVLHRRGFRIAFTIQPFISTDSENFKEAVRKKILIYERYSERSIPALTRYKSVSSAGMLDITNNASVHWLKEKLQKLKKEYQVDSFYLDLGIGYNLPHYYQCQQILDNPDMYAKLFMENFADMGIIGISMANEVPKPPAFLFTLPMNSSWPSLRKIMTTVLNYGIIGYPFVLPGAIGGDYVIMQTKRKMLSFYSLKQPQLPEKDLYIRWLQLATFMPAMQFNHLPSNYNNDDITNIAKDLISIRKTLVIPLIKKYLGESLNEGLPLVRPLWLLDPYDPFCLSVGDEFSLGNELIVAPILDKFVEEREVYLPQGVWKDGINGAVRKGSRWIHSYRVPKDKIAFFIKMPDNTRF